MKNKLLYGFVTTLVVAILLRVFVIDVVSVSNDLLQPHFYPGDFLLISKLSSPFEGEWALIKNYPQKSAYSIRQLVASQSDQGWQIVEPGAKGEKVFVESRQVVGQAVMILWSLPCRSNIAASDICSQKPYRYFKSIP
jgi:hypothetical protein